MLSCLDDVSPEEEQRLIQEAREMPAWRKIELVGEMTSALRGLIYAGLKTFYPQATETELKRRFTIAWLGRDLACEAYGWDQKVEG